MTDDTHEPELVVPDIEGADPALAESRIELWHRLRMEAFLGTDWAIPWLDALSSWAATSPTYRAHPRPALLDAASAALVWIAREAVRRRALPTYMEALLGVWSPDVAAPDRKAAERQLEATAKRLRDTMSSLRELADAPGVTEAQRAQYHRDALDMELHAEALADPERVGCVSCGAALRPSAAVCDACDTAQPDRRARPAHSSRSTKAREAKSARQSAGRPRTLEREIADAIDRGMPELSDEERAAIVSALHDELKPAQRAP
jgi:hypothetical protein